MIKRQGNYGFLMVAAAAGIWGTDALFRRNLALDFPPSIVVFGEHLLLVAMTFPLLRTVLPRLKSLNALDWLAITFVGAGASAAATILFTQSFSYQQDPTTPLLLQKLQPMIAIGGATLLLRERLLPHFAIYVIGTLGGTYLITFPDPAAVTLSSAVPALFAIGAACLWALGTVLGRYLTAKVSFTELTALRFAVGLPVSGLILLIQRNTNELISTGWVEWRALLLLALIPGLISLLLYSRGLRATPAAAATLAELTFPLTAILVGYFAFDAALGTSQWIGVAIVSTTITVMGLAGSRRENRGLGIELTKPAPALESG